MLLAGFGLLALSGAALLGSAEMVGLSLVAVTAGAAVGAVAIGVCDPLTKGLAMGVFTRNLGLISGVISGLCYAWIAASAALLAWLPERSQAPMGWFYLVAAAGLLALLWTARGRLEPDKASDSVGPPSPR